MNKFALSLRKALSLLLSIVLLASLAGCGSQPVVIKDSDTCIVIHVPEDADEMLLIDYMNLLKENGELSFEVQSGMVSTINGVENAADFSSCWMLYTSDADFSNSAWGTVEYDGTEYGSAIVGAEVLTVKPGQLYIWAFMSF